MSKIVSYWYLVMRLWIQHQRGVGGGQCWQYNNVNPAIVIILWYSNYRENICQPYLYISGYHKVPSQTIPHYSPDHPHHSLLWCLGQGIFRYSTQFIPQIDLCSMYNVQYPYQKWRKEPVKAGSGNKICLLWRLQPLRRNGIIWFL